MSHRAETVIGMSVEAKVDTLLRVVADCGEDRVPASEPQLRDRLRDPAVGATARAAADAGLLRSTNRGWALTSIGRERATSAVRRHRTIEAFLAQVLGVAWAEVHAEACRWEQVAGDIVVAKMAQRLRDRVRSPYGGTIPPSSKTGPSIAPERSVALTEAVRSRPRSVRLVRIGEVLQDDPEQLPRLAAVGCFPGVEMLATPESGGTRLEAPGGPVHLSARHAAAVFVEPVE
jgi:DtxR family transcriptional regulator, Mn-dependent transcriptional regulator